jgi:DNA topoisomerase I
MSKSLLIVESPTKAKTLGRYLGKDFVVKASVGHIKDLPKNKLGIDLEKDFQADYQLIRGKKKIIDELTAAAAKASAIYLGPDPDREGEAIAWHIAESINAGKTPIHRVLFYELTQKAIEEALAHPRELNRERYEAQQARRILDRLVGYQISPILWQKVKRGLSAGRVQSVALRLICEREKEIQEFTTEEYWTIEADLLPKALPGESEVDAKNRFTAHLWRCRKKKCTIPSADEADHLVQTLRPLSYQVSKVDLKKRRKNPAPPFITSSLQQEAARRLRLSAKQTMRTAQKLYEGIDVGSEGAVGLITYMRTDSTRLSPDAVQAARTYIGDTWSAAFLPGKPVFYKAKAGAQDAHEAIRPTDVQRTPEKMAHHLSKEQLNLYTLIWKRFVASQMAPAVIAQKTVDIAAGEFVFRATGSTVEFPGFMVLYVESQENEDPGKGGETLLPELSEGQPLSLLELKPKQHFTQPPPRYSEASLIKELEELGIGRPSTYATILSTVLEREYVAMQKQRLHPSELGWFINGLLVQNFPNIVDTEFTAKMEKSLDEIERGQYPYLQLLNEFYGQFSGTLKSAQSNMLNMKGVGWPTELKCPRCERGLQIRWSRNGPFIACSGYPECSFSSNYERDDKGGIRLLEENESSGETCDKCGRPMVLKRGRYGAFLACSGYPGCRNTRSVSTGIPCPREGCSGLLVERVSKTGRRFLGCNRYPDCKTAVWGRVVQKTCPGCGASALLEKQDRKGGQKLVCINPACKYQEKTPRGIQPDNHDLMDHKEK